MDIKKQIASISSLFKKYKYVVLVLLIGLVLMLLPELQNNKKNTQEDPSVETVVQRDVQTELEQILSKVSGAGQVKVMLTVAQGEQIIYQTDENINVSDNSSTTKKDTITVTDDQRSQTGLIKQIIPPTYLGAIVLCQGADRASVRLEIIEAVSKITGLGADKIAVLKMN